MPEKIESKRLILRKPILEDGEEIFQPYASDPEVTKYLAWTPHINLEESQAFISERKHEWENRQRFSWIIVKKANNNLIGMISTKFSTDFRASISYVTSKANWGKGFATEATKAVVDMLFESDRVYRVEALCDVENVGSKKVMIKIGMAFEGRLNRSGYAPNISHEPRDCFCFSITK